MMHDPIESRLDHPTFGLGLGLWLGGGAGWGVPAGALMVDGFPVLVDASPIIVKD